jgi:hypothetical protein
MLQVLIVTHIAAGLAAVILGAAAMIAPKQPGSHPRRGRGYLVALTVLAATATGLAIVRPHAAFLLIIGSIALAAAGLGYTARRVRWSGWLPWHITGMATSYMAALTAFYVDNGPRLPLWRLLPPMSFWFLPSAIGIPVLVWALLRHRQTPSADST